MSVDYRIKAYPTMSRGRQYRSRLEARWAAFFDLLNWNAEYEPFDLGKWSPDFRLRDLVTGATVLVEVKPLDEIDKDTCKKIEECREERNIDVPILLTGVAPRIGECGEDVVSIGWILGETTLQKCVWRRAELYWVRHWERPSLVADVAVDNLEQTGRSGALSCYPFGYDDYFSYGRHTMELWAQATNEVQWQPEK